MRSILSRGRRGDAALALAALSLFVSLGGTGWARRLIDGRALKRGSVTTSRLHRGAVTTSRLANDAVTSAKVRDATLTRSDLNPSVFAGLQTALVPGSITNPYIADGAVTSTKLAPGAVVNATIGSGAVTSSKLGSGAVTNSRLGANSVATGKILNHTITGADVATDTLGAANIGHDAVTGTELDASGSATLNFDVVPPSTCATQTVTVTSADLTNDVVVATPDPTFTGTTFSIHPQVLSATTFAVVACNIGTAAADPDGATGAPFRYVAIDV